MRIAVVENMADTPLGLVGAALDEAGAAVTLFRPYLDGALPALADHDGLIVLGGEQNARDDDAHPYLPHLAARMAEFGAADRAVLGICLGSQLLARAHGAENRIGTAREFGWTKIAPTSAGRADPVFAAFDSAFPAFQWHDDTFTLPEGAAHLAASGRVAHQAYRVGRASYGMQFHFEAGRAVVRHWAETLPHLMDRMDPAWRADHAAHEAAHGAAADAAGLAIARAWLALV